MFVQDPSNLERLLERWCKAPQVGLDTEFIRERTFFPQLCLVQVGLQLDNQLDVYALDSIAFDNQGELISEYLSEWQGEVIAHSFSQDVEILAGTPWLVGAKWFDTQIAASLLGWNLQLGYAPLVEELLGIKLDKGASRTNWAQRPLSGGQLKYALDDVRYLEKICELLKEKLDAKNRLSWAYEDSLRLFEKSQYVIPSDKMYKKLKGYWGARDVWRKRARYLSSWREDMARKKDIPRGWILKDDLLWQVVAQGGVEGISIKSNAAYINDIIKKADEADFIDDDLVEKSVPNQNDKQTKSEMKNVANQLAKQLGIESNVLITMSEIGELMHGKFPDRLQNGWRCVELQPLFDEFCPKMAT